MDARFSGAPRHPFCPRRFVHHGGFDAKQEKRQRSIPVMARNPGRQVPIRTVRSHAKEWNVNPASVGIMGFSAGGELAALAAADFANPVKGSNDAIDMLDCRPDFQALFYPGLAREQPILTPQTPPAFLCGAYDDSFNLTTPMVKYYLKLAESRVPTELHVYARDGHGFGIRDEGKSVYTWMSLFRTWLGGLEFSAKQAP
jgi:endo-1,4-beta-xylanase